MNAHVLITRTSASSGRDVISIPCCKTLPSMISASTRFLAQPRLIMPIFGRCSSGNDSPFAPNAFGATTGGEFMTALVNRYVFVVIFQRLAIFCDLNGVRIENTDRNMLTAEFNSAVSWRNPTLERGTPLPIAYGRPHIRSFEWANSDAICSPGSTEDEFGVSCAFVRSSRVTGFARRTSGLPDAVEAE